LDGSDNERIFPLETLLILFFDNDYMLHLPFQFPFGFFHITKGLLPDGDVLALLRLVGQDAIHGALGLLAFHIEEHNFLNVEEVVLVGFELCFTDDRLQFAILHSFAVRHIVSLLDIQTLGTAVTVDAELPQHFEQLPLAVVLLLHRFQLDYSLLQHFRLNV
jgi:hypothetical protein